MDQTDAVDGPLLFNTDHSLTSRYASMAPTSGPSIPNIPSTAAAVAEFRNAAPSSRAGGS
jgi:hypothetical protein